MNYEQKTMNSVNKNKAKQTQFKANLLEKPMNVSIVLTDSYENKPRFLAQKSQTQFPKQPKMNITPLIQRITEPVLSAVEGKMTKTNPKQTQSCLAEVLAKADSNPISMQKFYSPSSIRRRMLPKLLNVQYKNSLTGQMELLKCVFFYGTMGRFL